MTELPLGMGKGVSLPFSVAAGVRVYLMDPVLAFIVLSSEAIKLSETYSIVHTLLTVFLMAKFFLELAKMGC